MPQSLQELQKKESLLSQTLMKLEKMEEEIKNARLQQEHMESSTSELYPKRGSIRELQMLPDEKAEKSSLWWTLCCGSRKS